MTSQTIPEKERSGYFPTVDGSYLRFTGETRQEFLQRQTTNHVDLLTPDRSLLTVLTSPTARILDVLILLDEGDAIGALTLPGRGERTAQFLGSRIFFNDRVTLTNATNESVQVDVFGPKAEVALNRLVETLSKKAAPEAIAAIEISQTVVLGAGVRIVRMEPTFGMGYRLLLPRASLNQVAAILEQSGLEQITADEFDCLRVEAGLPSAGHELTEEYTPLETGLLIAVLDSKGCYTGQEVIARQITYDKVTRLLCGLRLSGPAEAGSELISLEGIPAGKLTSAVESPRLGWIGLGVVKRPYLQRGTVLRVGPVEPDGAVAKVGMLPFSTA